MIFRPTRPYIPSEMEVALQNQVPVKPKLDSDGNVIPPKHSPMDEVTFRNKVGEPKALPTAQVLLGMTEDPAKEAARILSGKK